MKMTLPDTSSRADKSFVNELVLQEMQEIGWHKIGERNLFCISLIEVILFIAVIHNAGECKVVLTDCSRQGNK